MAFRIGDRVRFKQGVSAGANYRGLIGTITGAPRTGMTDERIVMCNLGMTKSLTSALGYSSWRSQRERRRVLAALSHSARRASGWARADLHTPSHCGRQIPRPTCHHGECATSGADRGSGVDR
jgi:hypothetical protein